jgi:hypothetical protein
MNHVDKSRFVKNVIGVLGCSNTLVQNRTFFTENNSYLVI